MEEEEEERGEGRGRRACVCSAWLEYSTDVSSTPLNPWRHWAHSYWALRSYRQAFADGPPLTEAPENHLSQERMAEMVDSFQGHSVTSVCFVCVSGGGLVNKHWICCVFLSFQIILFDPSLRIKALVLFEIFNIV